MICIANKEDSDQIKKITESTAMFNSEEVQCVADIFQQYVQLGQEASGYSFFVEKENNNILGFVCVGPRGLADRVFDLYWIAVDPGAQRKGIGQNLLKKAEEEVILKHGRIMVIETSGTEKYQGTRAFYTSSGYLLEATLKNLYADGDDLCIFTKRLGD